MMPATVKDLMDHWKYGFMSYRGRVIWKLMLVVALWNVWFARNCRVFQNERRSIHTVVDLIFYRLSIWAANCKEFDGYSSADISRSWSSLLVGGRHA